MPPTVYPTRRPTDLPTRPPTRFPTRPPTPRPTPPPTPSPTTERPSTSPTRSFTPTTLRPSATASAPPTQSNEPSDSPTQSEEPSATPTQSDEPSANPTNSEEPSEVPTQSDEPSDVPTQSDEPTYDPTTFDLFFPPYRDPPTTTAQHDDPVLVTSLFDIICAPENNNLLGIFCLALRTTGLAPIFDVVYVDGNLRRNNQRNLQNRNNNNNYGTDTQYAQYPQYTMFGPTNEAFHKLGETTLQYLLNTERGHEHLTDVLLYHVISGSRINFQQLVCGHSYTMMNEQHTTSICRAAYDRNGLARKFQVGTGNGQNVHDWPELIDGNNYAINGVLHIVDEVLLPDTFHVPTRAPTVSKWIEKLCDSSSRKHISIARFTHTPFSQYILVCV